MSTPYILEVVSIGVILYEIKLIGCFETTPSLFLPFSPQGTPPPHAPQIVILL